jgi:anaerobic magnesium-protoporphyrin IX monomethyl ester cyclase
MKVLLATMSVEDDSRYKHEKNSAYSLGLAYLHSIIESKGYTVKTLFLNNYDAQKADNLFFKTINEFAPTIVGLQIFSMNRTSTFNIIEKLTDKKIKIIIGGIHTTLMYEQILKKYTNIITVLGEGEITLPELLNCIEKSKDLSKIKGIAYSNNGKIVTTSQRELLLNLDSLPRPKHEVFFDMDEKRTTAHMITSRGCPFKCSFCALPAISHAKYRNRSVDNVIQEIVFLKKRYPKLSHIQFHDDTMLLNNSRVIELCKKIIDLEFNLTFECSARVKPVSEELFYWMHKAGFTKIMFGLESGSVKILDSIGKKISPADVVHLFNTLKKFNFFVTTFLMCGFPGESEETIKETIILVNKIQKIKYSLIVGIGILWVYPGTEIYKTAKRKGFITDDYWMTDKCVPYYTFEHSYKKLQKFENILMDHVSITRIFTWNGFRYHFLKMPLRITCFIIKFIVRYPDKLNKIYSRLFRKNN